MGTIDRQRMVRRKIQKSMEVGHTQERGKKQAWKETG